jgi:hypothetical protein
MRRFADAWLPFRSRPILQVGHQALVYSTDAGAVTAEAFLAASIRGSGRTGSRGILQVEPDSTLRRGSASLRYRWRMWLRERNRLQSGLAPSLHRTASLKPDFDCEVPQVFRRFFAESAKTRS